MQAIGFNEHYSLQTAVIKRIKTNTRRLEKGLENLKEGYFHFFKERNEVVLYGEKRTPIEIIRPRYKIGEVVAIRQSYSEVYNELFGDVAHIDNDRVLELHMSYILMEAQKDTIAGWTNKMFIKPDLMIHHIRITDNKVERLQDISDTDCFAEGVEEDSPYYWVWTDKDNPNFREIGYELSDVYKHNDGKMYPHFWDSPQKAFARLIDKVSGKGTWESNPWVFAYSFELID